jgi:hypothetical protein
MNVVSSDLPTKVLKRRHYFMRNRDLYKAGILVECYRDRLLGCRARISFMIILFQMKVRNGRFIMEPVVNLFKWKHYESEIILLTVR